MCWKWKSNTESATGVVLEEKVFLEISQNSQENNCARASFSIKLHAGTCNFIKKEIVAQVFSLNFVKYLRTCFLAQLWATASASLKQKLCKNNFWNQKSSFYVLFIFKLLFKFSLSNLVKDMWSRFLSIKVFPTHKMSSKLHNVTPA